MPSDQNVDNLLDETTEYASPLVVAGSANLRNWSAEYKRSIETPTHSGAIMRESSNGRIPGITSVNGTA
jgi:hypothetical protein